MPLQKDSIVLKSQSSTKAAMWMLGPLAIIMPIITYSMIDWADHHLFSMINFVIEANVKWIGAGIACLVGLLLTSIAIIFAKNSVVRVSDTDAMVWVQRGFWTLDHNYIPMQQIMDMDVRQDLLERMLGLASISILTMRHERIIVKYLENGMDFSNELLGIIQKNGGMMRSANWIVDQQ